MVKPLCVVFHRMDTSDEIHQMFPLPSTAQTPIKEVPRPMYACIATVTW